MKKVAPGVVGRKKEPQAHIKVEIVGPPQRVFAVASIVLHLHKGADE